MRKPKFFFEYHIKTWGLGLLVEADYQPFTALVVIGPVSFGVEW